MEGNVGRGLGIWPKLGRFFDSVEIGEGEHCTVFEDAGFGTGDWISGEFCLGLGY